MSDGEVALAVFVHPHLLIEAHCRVFTVHVELQGAGRGVVLGDVVGGRAEEFSAQADALKLWQHVDFLKVEEVFLVLLDAHVACRLVVGVGYVVGVSAGELLGEALHGVHPFHHVLCLFACEDVAVGVWEHLPCHLVYQRAVVGCGPAYSYSHCLCVYIMFGSGTHPRPLPKGGGIVQVEVRRLAVRG